MPRYEVELKLVIELDANSEEEAKTTIAKEWSVVEQISHDWWLMEESIKEVQ